MPTPTPDTGKGRLSGAIRTAIGLVAVPGGDWVRRVVWQRLPWYWHLRSRLQHGRFLIRRRVYLTRRDVHERARTVSVGVEIVRAVIWPALGAVAFVGLLAIGGTLVDRSGLTASWLASWRANSGTDRASSLTALYGTVVQIAGVFLGLYFATLSVLASTSYREVPADLRAVVVQERAGAVYLKLVAFTGAAALYNLGGMALGFDWGPLNAGATVVLAAVSILSFVLLGLRAFTFFDPSALSVYLTARIADASRDATPAGYRWDDPSFQVRAQTEAEQAAGTLRTLVAVTAAAPHASRALRDVGVRCLGLLRFYAELKPEIPPASRWFARIGRHQSWLTANTTTLEMALNTGSGIAPEEMPDPEWLERHITDTVTMVVSSLIKDGEARDAIAVLQASMELAERLAGQFQLEPALRLHRALLKLVPLVLSEQTSQDKLYQLATADQLFAAPCTIIAAFGRAARSLKAEDVTQLASRVRTEPEDSPVRRGLPPTVRGNIQFFRRALAFERDVEGRPLTPNWFVAHHIARVFGLDLVRMFQTLVEVAEETYGPEIDRMRQAGAVQEVVVAIQRGRGACSKLEFHLQWVQKALRELETLCRAFGEQDWASLDAQLIRDRVIALDDRMLRTLAAITPSLPTAAPTGELPDDFGYACTTLGEGAFQSLLSERRDVFADLFPPYLGISLAAHDRVGKELVDRPLDTRLIYSADIILDVLELSGYAYVDSATLGGNAWSVVKAAWDSYLGSLRDPAAIIRLLALKEEYRSQSFVMSARDLLRTSWQQRYERKMRGQGLMADRWQSGWDRDTVRAEPIDPVAHAYVRRSGLSDDARDVFFVAYLLQRSEAKDIPPPRGARELGESVQRLQDRRREATRTGGGVLSTGWPGPWFTPATTTEPSSADTPNESQSNEA